MAVTNEKSAVITQIEADPQDLVTPRDWLGRLRFVRVNFTQGAAAGDAGSTADLALLPQGRCTIVGGLSKLFYDAFGAARTLDIGHTGFTNRDGTVVAADPDAFVAAEDVSGAGSTELDNTAVMDAGHLFDVDARDRVTIQAAVSGGTIPAGTKIFGHIAVVVD